MVSRRSLKKCLILFAKGLEPGKVKTRLCPPLTYSQACRVYRALLTYTVHEIKSLKKIRKVISYTGSLSSLHDFNSSSLEWIPQGEGDLGQRLKKASLWSIHQGNAATVIIGSDAFVELGQRITRAFERLKKYDLVVGPAWDGGFYLLGFKNELHPDFFKGIRWSTGDTLMDTLLRAKRHSYRTGILPMGYDVDDKTGLQILKMEFRRKDERPHVLKLFQDLHFIKDVLN
jgi:rSAM/selenodomain-associated transferase 1